MSCCAPHTPRESLQALHTFGCPTHAVRLYRITTPKTLDAVLSRGKEGKGPYLPLGGGSNVLFRGDYEGIVLKIEIDGITRAAEDRHHVWLRIGAGVPWQSVVAHCLSKGYYGIENLTHIPGCMGAAPIQNIGAYGVELTSCFQELEATSTKTRETRTFAAKDCHFGYRHSIFKEPSHRDWVITQVTLRLRKRFSPIITYQALQEALAKQGLSSPTARQVADTVASIRQAKLPDPKTLGNAGSFFKNPTIPVLQYRALQKRYPACTSTPVDGNQVKMSASALIEMTEWKGKRVGEVGVHEKHALVLVNYGRGTGQQVWQLAQEIQKDVAKKFGIMLEPELTLL